MQITGHLNDEYFIMSMISRHDLKHWWYQTSQILIDYIFQKSSRVLVQKCCAVVKGGLRLERAVPVHRRSCSGNI